MAVCEICNDTQHVKADGGGWQHCQCYYRNRASERYAEAGFPLPYFGLTAAEALEMTGFDGDRDPNTLKQTASWLIQGDGALVSLRSRGRDTSPIACWLAANVALAIPVRRFRLSSVIDESFTGDVEAKRFERFNKLGELMVIEAFGTDRPHMWNEPILGDILTWRVQHGVPTIISPSALGASEGKVRELYGDRVCAAMANIKVQL